MRKVAAIVLVTIFCAGRAHAQSSQDSPNRHRFVKVVVGVAALAIGATVAARSSETTTVTTSAGLPAEISTHSTSQLVTGLVIVGAGAIVLWDGLRDHGASRPSTAVGVTAGKASGGVFVRRTW
jgi:hypothetical protein